MPLPGLCTSVYVNPLVTLNGSTDATGTYNVPVFSVAFSPTWIGLHLYGQVAVYDPTRSNPLKVCATNGTNVTVLAPPAGFRCARLYAPSDSGAATTGTLVPSYGLVIRLD